MALVSCFVWQDRMDKGTRLREKLQSVFVELQQTARRIAKVPCQLHTAPPPRPPPPLTSAHPSQPFRHQPPFFNSSSTVVIGDFSLRGEEGKVGRHTAIVTLLPTGQWQTRSYIDWLGKMLLDAEDSFKETIFA